jgi:NADPH:quinone reductase-like Zn-dependent oxidoreductase
MLQMAKALGAYVLGTASGKGVELIKTLGADEVIDYKNQDFTQLVKDMDVVVDLVGKDPQVKSFDVLKKGGRLVSTVMPPSQELAQKHEVQAEFVSATAHYTKLDFGNTLIEQNKIKAHVAQVMKLEQAAKAQDMISGGGINGKIVLEIK